MEARKVPTGILPRGEPCTTYIGHLLSFQYLESRQSAPAPPGPALLAPMEPPTPEDARRDLATLDTRDQKIVAGLLGLMMQNAAKVRDREWMSQQLAEVTVLAGDFEPDSADDGVRLIEDFLKKNASRLLEASFLLFRRVSLDMAPRVAEGFTFEEAMRCALSYFPSIEGAAPSGATGTTSEPE